MVGIRITDRRANLPFRKVVVEDNEGDVRVGMCRTKFLRIWCKETVVVYDRSISACRCEGSRATLIRHSYNDAVRRGTVIITIFSDVSHSLRLENSTNPLG